MNHKPKDPVILMNHKPKDPVNLMNHKPKNPVILMNHKPKDPVILMNHKPKDPVNLMNHKPKDPVNLMNHKPKDSVSLAMIQLVRSSGALDMEGVMFDPLVEMAGYDADGNDGVPHPMEEVPERRSRGPAAGEEGVRGLSEEEFQRIFDEVGYEMDFQTVYVVRPLRSRTAAEVTAAVQETVLKMKAEGLYISRIHADRARELRVQSLRTWALQRGIFCTFTEGQAPQSNGRAEAAVKWVKGAVKRLLTATDLPKDTWAVAANYAVQDRMDRLLRKSPSMLPFGTKVHVRSKVYGTGGKYDLDSRWKGGTYVGPSLDVRGGHLIRFENGAYMTSTHLRPHLVEPDKIIDLEEYEALLPVPTRRIKGKAGAREVEGELGDHEECFPHDPDHPAECYARRLLEEEDGALTADQLENLAIMLPSTAPTPKRFGPQKDTQKIWNAGAFVHGGIVGVKTATGSFPASTRAFVKYVKQLKPDHKFNAIAVTTDVEAKQHVDAHNVGENLVAGLSYFKGGALEVEEPTGVKVLPLDGDVPYQVFEPKHRHSTRPWYGGSRVVLIAYSVRDSAKLKEPHLDLLRGMRFEWEPHLSKPVDDQDPPALKVIRVGLLDASAGHGVPEQHRDSPEYGGLEGRVADHGVPEQPRDSPEYGGEPDKVPQVAPVTKEAWSHIPHDLELAIGDMEDRAARLRDLLEEEEILAEEYRRMGEETREHVSDARDQVCEFLDYVHKELMGLERLRSMMCLKAARVTPVNDDPGEIDYEALLDSLEEDLKIVHTVPAVQVKQYLSRWTEAIKKEVEALFSSGTLRKVSLDQAKEMESQGLVTFAPAKCIFTLKPPQVQGKRVRRKCRLVICGNFVKDNVDFGDLYAAGSSTDSLRLTLIVSALMNWFGAISDITGAFLLATWPEHLPKYGIYPPRLVRESGVAGHEAWIVERPLYGLRESPRIWCDYRNKRLLTARIPVDNVMLVLRPTVSEPELWTIIDEVTGVLYGLIVLYVDDIAYFSTKVIVKAVHEFVVKDWPASPLEWIGDVEPVRYLGVEIKTEARVAEDGSARRVFTIGQSAYVRDLLRSYGMEECFSTQLPVPKDWIDQAENNDEPEEEITEEATKRAQRVVGELLWLATKTRPDLLFTTNHMASMLGRRPDYVHRVGLRVLAYLSGTVDVRLTLGPTTEVSKELVCFTDASYAPYGRRSFGAAVVTLAGSPLAWKAGRQSFVTLSVMESELYAATQGCTLLCSVHSLLNELFPNQYQKVLAIDNTSAVSMCQGGHGSQRTRHLKIRASYIRENVENGTLTIRHTPGEWQLADLATKAQPKLRLHRLMQLWGFVGFATNWVKELKLKLMMVLVTIAQCICPARGVESEVKEPLPGTGVDELLLVCLVTSVFAVVLWEVVRYVYRKYLRWSKRQRKAKKLEEVARAEEQRSGYIAHETEASYAPDSKSSYYTKAVYAGCHTGTLTYGKSDDASADDSAGTQRTYHRCDNTSAGERMRVCYDVLMLMTSDELRETLRRQGLPVSGLKMNQAERLVESLMSTDCTNRQFRYVLYLWRHKSLSYKCRLVWSDIERLLGRGAAGEVWQAAGRASGSRVAVKCIDLGSLTAKERHQASQEAYLLRRVKHPHIVRFFDCIVGAQQMHIVMQLMEGGDLASVIRRCRDGGQRPSEASIWRWLLQMARALAYLHKISILHRDVKPANIFLSEDERTAVLGDLGIAKVESGVSRQL
ncbi:GIP [Symbiodinium sp. CCMP2592]|nr:GIP [Symbiodinium sp. CCMP2592]